MRAMATGRWAVVAVALAVLCAIGCAATPREKYEASETLYTRSLQGLALAAAAGELDADDLGEIEPYRAAVRAGLDRAKEIVQSGGELTEADVRVFDAALNAWLEAMVRRGVEEAGEEEPSLSPRAATSLPPGAGERAGPDTESGADYGG